MAATAYGAYSSYDTNRKAANFATNSAAAAAKQEQYNSEHEAAVLTNQAKQEQLNRAAAASEEERQARHRRASAEAMYAKSGVLMEGTPEYMLGEQAQADIMGIDQRTLESVQKQRMLAHGAQVTLMGGKFNAETMISQGQAQAFTYKAQGRAAIISGVGSMLSGAASAAGSMSAPTATSTSTAGTASYGTRTAPTIANGPAVSNYQWAQPISSYGG